MVFEQTKELCLEIQILLERFGKNNCECVSLNINYSFSSMTSRNYAGNLCVRWSSAECPQEGGDIMSPPPNTVPRSFTKVEIQISVSLFKPLGSFSW